MSFDAGASCSTPPILKCFGISIVPLSTPHSFFINLNKLVLPVPLRPTIPILWPVGILTEASSKSAIPPIENDSFFIFNITYSKKN